MGLSRRAYAAKRGVSHTAVGKAIATGRITVEPDGTIDPVKADADWDALTNPNLQRVKPVPHAAMQAVADTLREAGETLGDGPVTYQEAKTANEVLKAQTAKVRLAKLKGELVDRVRATNLFFEFARRERDAWLSWPARSAANMAAELGVDAHKVEQVLDSYLREHLGELAEAKIALGAA